MHALFHRNDSVMVRLRVSVEDLEQCMYSFENLKLNVLVCAFGQQFSSRVARLFVIFFHLANVPDSATPAEYFVN